MYRSEQCALERQEKLRTVRNGVHVLPNGEVEGPDHHAGQAPRAHTVPRRTRRGTTVFSRPPPTMVRRMSQLRHETAPKRNARPIPNVNRTVAQNDHGCSLRLYKRNFPKMWPVYMAYAQ